jgi:hypothetical protein
MSKTPYFRLLLRFCGIGLLLFAGLQFVRPELRNPPVTAEIQAPAEVKAIFKHSCYNCHSNETELAWFDRVVPAYWIVSRDVRRARAHLNFSEIGALPEEQQKLALFDAFNQIRLGAMPLPSYRAAHPNSAITAEQLAILRNYLAPRSQEPPATVSEVQAADREYVRWTEDNRTVRSVQNTLGGLPFIPSIRLGNRSAARTESKTTPYALFSVMTSR